MRALRQFAQNVRGALGSRLLELKLYGSKATGRDEPESDIDVLVLVDQASPELEDQVIDIAFEVNLAQNVYISPRVIDRAILDDPLSRVSPFFEGIHREGVPL